MLDQIADLPGPELDLASYSDAYDEAYNKIIFGSWSGVRPSGSLGFRAGRPSRRATGIARSR